MLSNRTYFGIKDITLEMEALKECAVSRAMNKSMAHTRKSDRAFFQLSSDKRGLTLSYKKLREHFESGGEFSVSADAFCDNFYVVEKNMTALLNGMSDVRAMKLPVCGEGDLFLLPRVYAIAVDMVGHREGRIDENLIEEYMGAYQSITHLTIQETAVLPYMIKTALLKLIRKESDECVKSIRSIKKAEQIADALLKVRDDMVRQQSIILRAELFKEAELVDRLVHILSDKSEYMILERLYSNLENMDVDIEALIVNNRRLKTHSAKLMMNAINSLRLLDSVDLEALFERICKVEHELLEDETYRAMDKKSRAYYRSCVERLAHKLKTSQTLVAKKAVLLAKKADENDEYKSEAGYYLFKEGRGELYSALRPDKTYREYTHAQKLWTLLTFQIALLIPILFLASTGGIVATLIAVFPAWTIANFVVVRIAVKNSTPKIIPRLSLENGVGEENRTLVVVPTLISDEKSLDEAVTTIETHYLSNPLDNCYFAVLSDFPDSENEQNDGEAEILKKAESEFSRLNKKYSKNDETVFYFLHRKRQYLESDGIYMGHERKRGALMALTRYIVTGEKEEFLTITSPLPENLKYCLTLDSDTVLNKETLKELIGALAHPQNKPVLDENGIVKDGYGIIVPNMRVLASSASKSIFSRLFSQNCGLDIYAGASSEFYQDIFSEGTFGGKGIFNIDVFYNTLDKWIKENSILSHDLLEGCFLRAGYMSDVTLFDTEPSNFISWWKRSHRWIRGDWQLLPYLWFYIKDADGEKRKNPLNLLSRWKILENMRRTMLSSGILYTLLVFPYIGFSAYVIIALASFLEEAVIDLTELFIALARSKKERYNAKGLFKERINTFKKSFVKLATLPYETLKTSDAMSKALFRMFISKKKLLEWQTASQTGKTKNSLISYYKELYVCPLFGIAMLISIFLGGTPLFSSLLAVLFLLAPFLVFQIDKADEDKKLDDESEEFLRILGRSTWRFFATLCNEKTAYLPPDNYQAFPEKHSVLHTSPTNIGMGLMANLCAYDMSFIGKDEFLLRTKRMLISIENAEKWHGHLYNWYSLPTLRVLPPKYVSTVDSGNLAAALLTLEQALLKMGAEALASCAGALARNMDFTCLYDKSRSQFHIGYNAEANELSKSWYDLLASEARLTTVVAIALGQVKMKSYYSLSRLLVPTDKGRTLISWSGTMFEYLMPMLFTPAYKGTLLYESAQSAVKTQIAYNRELWGISESGYYAFDKQKYYQYRAFGVPKLSLMPTHERELVISPYSSALALLVDKRSAVKNLVKLSKLGMLSKFGMYEALDMTKSRMKGQPYEKVASFMAHHQGMTLCAINNILNKENIMSRFLQVPEIRSVKMLFEEKRPSMAIVIKDFESAVYKTAKGGSESAPHIRSIEWSKKRRTKETQLLSNGEYTVFVGEDASGFSKCNDIMLTRFRRENSSSSGVRFYIRLDNKVIEMSSRDERAPQNGEILFEPHAVTFKRRDEDITSKLKIAVSPDHNAEIRKLTLTNHSSVDREIEVGIFFDAALAKEREDISHTAFVKVRTDAYFKDDLLLYKRRSKKESENSSYIYTTIVSDDNAKIKYSTDRLNMPGRHRSEKEAMLIPMLNEDVQMPIETGFCSRITLFVKAEEQTSLSFIMGYAKSEKQAKDDAGEISKNIDGIMELAFINARNMLSFGGLSHFKADLFEKTAASLFAHNAHKNHDIQVYEGGIEKLWKMGISGDKMIILMCVNKITQMRITKTLLEFMAYIAARGIEAELIIIGEYPQEYSNELRRRLEELISTHSRLLDNVRLINGYDIDENQKALLLGMADLEIDATRSLDKQFLLSAHDEAEKTRERAPKKVYPLFGTRRGAFYSKKNELEFDNGFGGFDIEKKEYVIYKNGENVTPLPWCNILANEHFGTLLTENGGGFTWSKNSRLHKLTVPDYDILRDESKEKIQIADNDNGCVFCVSSNHSGNECRHGIGYTRFTSNEDEIMSSLTVFADSTQRVKYSVLTLKNPMMQKRSLSLMYEAEFCIDEAMSPQCVETSFDDNILFARSLRNDSVEYAFMAIANAENEIEYTGDKEHIKDGAIHSEHLNKKVGTGLGAMGALRTDITLKAGEEKTVIFLFGEDEKENIKDLVPKCDEAYTNKRKELLDASWEKKLSALKVKTGDLATDIMLNNCLLYQTYSSRIFAKTGYFQCSGATGFRDQLQDVLALKLTNPDLLRTHILRCASKQFEKGDVLHWWHNENQGIRTHCSDDKMFLPYALTEYIKVTQDYSILDEEVTYLKDVEIQEGQESIYCLMQDGEYKEPLYMHAVRAIDATLLYGRNSLLLMGGCDWNDSMDEVGRDGGESVWLSMFTVCVLESFVHIARYRGDMKRADDYLRSAKKLREAIEKSSWDGAWYKRAFLGDGTAIGSHLNDECSIDLISQAWAVFMDAEHKEEAIQSAEKMLVDYENGLIKLLTPPFDKTDLNVGYIKEYLPGVRENGGQYTHAAAWFLIALCKLGQGEKAERCFSMLNPINKTSDTSRAKRYKTEPYAVCGDVYSVSKNAGRGGWSHYTGGAGWLYTAGIEHILGIRKEGDELIISPNCAWADFEFKYSFGGAVYKVRVIRDENGEKLSKIKLSHENGIHEYTMKISY